MALLSGNLADVYAVSGAGTAFTAEACTSVTSLIYQINDVSKRVWDSVTAFVVLVGGVATQIPYQLSRASGKIIFQTAPGGAVTVTGAYLSVSLLSQANKWTLQTDQNKVMTATFGDTWEEHTSTTRKATATVGRFYNDEYFWTNRGAKILLVLYVKQSTGNRYMLVGHVSDGIDAENSGVLMENLSVTADGPVDYSAT